MKTLKKVFLIIIGVIAIGVTFIETTILKETVLSHECTTSYWNSSNVCINYSIIKSPILGLQDSNKVVVTVNGDSAKFYFWCQFNTNATDSQQFVDGQEVSYEQFSSAIFMTTKTAEEFYKRIEKLACY